MKTPRLFLLPLAVAFLPVSLRAAPPSAVPRPVETAPAAQLYAEATLDLKEGHRFESVAVRLRQAARQSPDDFRIPIALGCALASRAASLAYAESYAGMLADEQASFPDRLKAWRAAQKNPKADDFGAPEPTKPPQIVFRTKDDHAPFKLTPAQAALELSRHGLAAVREWEKAVALARTPDETAEAQNVRGWGLRLLEGTAVLPPPMGEMTALQAAPDNLTVQAFQKTAETAGKDAVKAFEAAVKAAPDNAVYWQGLGDALKSMDANPPRMIEAYQKSLKLKPRNGPLWYRLSSLLAKTDPKASEDALKQAAAQDTGNAYPYYQLAALQFKKMQFSLVTIGTTEQKQRDAAYAAMNNDKSRAAGREAIDSVERGNASPDFRRPVYAPPVPKLLRAAWNYFMALGDIFDSTTLASWREVARSANGYADVSARASDFAEGARAARASVGIGLKMSGDWPTRDSGREGGELLQTLVGIAVAAIGYRTLEETAKKTGDLVLQAQAAAEQAAFKRKADAYIAAVRLGLENGQIYADY